MYNDPPCKYGTEIKWGTFAGYCTIFMDDASGVWYEHHDDDNLWYEISAPTLTLPSETPAIPPSEIATDTTPTPIPVVNPPECTPIAGKPTECHGYDRYDCIDGKITFIESNSTRCGYQIPITEQDQLISGSSPTENQPAQSGSNTTMILVLLGAAALIGAFFIFKKKGEI